MLFPTKSNLKGLFELPPVMFAVSADISRTQEKASAKMTARITILHIAEDFMRWQIVRKDCSYSRAILCRKLYQSGLFTKP